jgi:ribonuclease G
MSSEILINITPMETRVALVENGVLQEVSVEREKNRGIVGNIYKGKVVRVLPGMQAAFVDIGLEKAGFLHVDDLREMEDGTEAGLDVRQYLRDGQSIVVQVIKDPISTKGARLSTKLSVSSRYLVYMPYEEHIGISQRIEDESERLRLREQLDQAIENVGRIEGVDSIDSSEVGGGYILRTAAEGVDSEELTREVGFLQQLWRHVSETAKMVEAPALVYKDLPIFLRVLRDMANPQIEKVKIDSQKNYQKLCDFSRRFNPEMLSILEYYCSDRPLFYLHGVEDEITRALEKTVPLKSGGSLVIEQTEAMTTVDVNTGAFVGRRNLEETTYKTNLEAASTIARQLRLRNLGGIIIIDFIDMKDPEHRRQVMRALEKALSRDRAKTTIVSVSALGLVEMTRKRSSESLGRTLCQPCPVCEGKGRLKSAETTCYEIFRDVLREARTFECEKFLVLAAQVVIDRLLDEESSHVADLEEFVGKTLEFQVESAYSQEQFDIIPV